MTNDFAMIKTVITCRLNKAVGEVVREINEYNRKINEMRAPIIARIQKHYAERHNLSLVHPVTGNPVKKEHLNLTAQYLNDGVVRINASYNEVDDITNASFNFYTHIPLSDDFKEELKGKDNFVWESINIDSLATEKAAEIVVEGIPQTEIMKVIENHLKNIVPVVNIPKIEGV